MPNRTNDLVTGLLDLYAASELRQYQGNLAFAILVARNGWLPAENDPKIQQHLETLRHHLRQTERPEDDSYLLRLGLTTPGTQRGIVPPLKVLDVNRGGFSVRRQREAEGTIRRLREALAIGRQFVPGLSPDTQQAVSELADLTQRQPSPRDTDWTGRLAELSSDQADQLGRRAIAFLDSNEEQVHEIGTQILQHLACFRQPPLNQMCCDALLERRIFWPSNLYRDSGDAVANQLISLIEDPAEQEALNHLLAALAWTRSDAALQAFGRWAEQPPIWASGLHAPPAEFLQTAGWCLDESGDRRDLISLNCFRLARTEDATSRSVRCRTRIRKRCPSCGGHLGWLFDFSQLSADCFPGEFAEAPRKLLFCHHCACYEPVFTSYLGDGSAELISLSEQSKNAVPRDLEECMRLLDDSICLPFACAEAFALQDASTLGGIPMWLQHAAFPRCIECGRLMTFLAQHDNGPLGDEGIYYAFFCAPCHVAAVSYQQT